MTAQKPTSGTAAAPLLYWLLVVCGLAGVSLQRFGALDELVPLWIGTIAGVGLGQSLAFLRMRAWLLALAMIAAFWVAPIVFFVAYSSFGSSAETCVFAFLPAALCGYLSLSERGALVAFWYPAVLWMLVILDGPVAGLFDARAALPFLAGLGALFVAFLRARETRRVALWQGYGAGRLAKVLPRTVLRTSPLRATSELAWTGFTGVAALVLAAWIAPHLWQKEQAKHDLPQTVLPEQTAGGDELPCCPDVPPEPKQARFREYLPLGHRHDDSEYKPPHQACAACQNGHRPEDGAWSGTAGGISNGGGSMTSTTTPDTSSGSDDGSSGAAGSPSPTTTSNATEAVPKPAVAPSAAPVITTSKAHTATGRPTAIVLVPRPAAPLDPGAPWRSMLGLCAGGLGLHILVRAARRQLTLAHLARPFWNETVDQRVSNHWQRILIGLRDAGIHVASDEQPQALARRVGIEGIGTCATILERVRHGVRVDDADLEVMGCAAGAVYRAARERAGVTGRAASWLRWPLA